MSAPSTKASFVPGLMGESDAATWLGISPSTLRKLSIPRRKLGSRRLYDARDLEEFRNELPYEREVIGYTAADEAFGCAG